jgi:hypothetical protein
MKRSSARDLKNSSKIKIAHCGNDDGEVVCGNDDGEVVCGKGWPLLLRNWDKDILQREEDIRLKEKCNLEDVRVLLQHKGGFFKGCITKRILLLQAFHS